MIANMFGSCSNTADNTTSITAERIYADMARVMRELGPPPEQPRFDLYGSEFVDQLYEFRDIGWLMDLIPDSKGRRFLIAPRHKLDSIARQLVQLGADVRIEPRIRERGKQQAAVDGDAGCGL